ncbi:transposase, partial [Burkholderia multivorans]|uniref:transposase n=1 Tax=Burkholderia multivorans TaxID=87883 RepID=UPI003F556B97
WDRVIPFFAFPPGVRKIIYTTNAIENINSQLRKIIKTRGHFPSDEAATKLIWLALRNINLIVCRPAGSVLKLPIDATTGRLFWVAEP